MQELRAEVLDAFERLKNGEVDIQYASTLAKLSETVVSGLKSEMQYAILTGQQPRITFYGEGSGIALEDNKMKKLL